MKKKGLIVATIVMVLVLAVSLTTATYAWFTQSNVTTIDGFGIEVAASAAVNIGLKKNNTYDAQASADAFVSGTVNWIYEYVEHHPRSVCGRFAGCDRDKL